VRNLWDYDEDKIIIRLEKLKERYFRPVIAYPNGHLTHHGNCETHRAMDIYRYAPCTCGFLHDLDWLPESLTNKLWPDFYNDLHKQDAAIPGHTYWQENSEEKAKENVDLILKHFGPSISPTEEQWAEVTRKDWIIIKQVFGQEFCDRLKESKNE
jgi:hypothetical protein